MIKEFVEYFHLVLTYLNKTITLRHSLSLLLKVKIVNISFSLQCLLRQVTLIDICNFILSRHYQVFRTLSFLYRQLSCLFLPSVDIIVCHLSPPSLKPLSIIKLNFIPSNIHQNVMKYFWVTLVLLIEA